MNLVGHPEQSLSDSDRCASVLIRVLNGEQSQLEKAYSKLTGRSFTQLELQHSTGRVLRLVTALRELIEDVEHAADEFSMRGQDDKSSWAAKRRELEELHREINRLLSPYSGALNLDLVGFSTRVRSIADGAGVVMLNYRMVGVSRPIKVPGLSKKIHLPHSEAMAVDKIRKLLAEGKIMHLRRCLARPPRARRRGINFKVRCSRWFMAPRVDRYWCSRLCFIGLRETDPDYKQRLSDLAQLAY